MQFALCAQPVNCEFSGKNTKYNIYPETLKISADNKIISAAQTFVRIENLKRQGNLLFFKRGDCQVEISLNDEYMRVTFIPEKESIQLFPIIIIPDKFLLPIGEGLFFPSKDSVAINHFIDLGENSGTEKLSMQLFGVVFGEDSIVYIIENPFNNSFYFKKISEGVELVFMHVSKSISKLKQFSYRIYFFRGDTVTESAKLYRKYKIEKNEFKTLAEKAETIPNMKKLYGAPFIYLWGNKLVGENNIKWKKLQQTLKKEFGKPGNNPTKYFSYLLGKENSFLNICTQDYVSKYDYTSFDSDLAKLAEKKDLYRKDVFNNIELNSEAKKYLEKDIDKLTPLETIQLNMNLIQSVYKDSMAPVKEWGNGVSEFMIKELYNSGIYKAWLGIDDASLSYFHPQAISLADKLGFLIAPYDSYESIHHCEDDSWKTASFDDKSLYDKATIVNKNGEYVRGFLGKGRILNPMLSVPVVKQRISKYFRQGIEFNSWFVDCDGAGQLYTDYSKEHPMSEEEDAAAKNYRMKWIEDKFGIVVGTEDGKDYVANNIAFGHGITAPLVWDEDMAKNENSEYYLGSYYSPSGIPPRYIKETKLKPELKHVYYNPKLKVPLFQLVYNNSFIPSDHWEQGILKFPEVIKLRLLQCILFNVPPLFHLDKAQWKKDKDIILPFIKFWAPVHERLVGQEMIGFRCLSEDRLLQKTVFSDGTEIVANFKISPAYYGQLILPPESVIVVWENNSKTYLP